MSTKRSDAGLRRFRAALASQPSPGPEVSMSVSVDPCASPPSGTLSCYVTTAAAVAAAITFSASGAAPTPLYQEYQEHFGLTPFMITIIFAAYVLCLLLARL